MTIAAGLTNIVLDALFVAVFDWGITGAAAATAASQCVGGLIPIIYFAHPNSSILRLGKTKFDGKSLAKTCVNGSSELMSNISMSIVGMLYNKQLLNYAGEDGIAAYGVLMYVSLVFQAIFIGYSVGKAPEPDTACLFHFFIFIFIFRIYSVWLIIFYCIKQWDYFGSNILYANTGISDCRRFNTSDFLESGWHLVFHCCR